MKPNLEDFLSVAARWRGGHKGISYELSWHGMSDYSPEGTWCWYIFVIQEQFYPEDWARLRLLHEDKEFAGSWRRHFEYEKFPDIEPHGEWTFGEMDTYLARDGREYEQVKVGCDYAHLRDREGGYWQGKNDIERDVKRSIDLLVEMFPRRRLRCGYSGRYDAADQFYTAANGQTVHRSYAENFEDGWASWRPADDTAQVA